MQTSTRRTRSHETLQPIAAKTMAAFRRVTAKPVPRTKARVLSVGPARVKSACESGCARGKPKELKCLVCSLSQMTKAEKTTSLYTFFAVLMQVPVDRKRGSGDRERFNYYLSFVGQVCRPVFAKAYGVVPMTIQRYKKRIRDGNMAIKDHGNKLNKNASQVDVVWLVKWFTEFAEEVGEVVPVRVRMQKKIDGTTQKFYSRDKYTLLSVYFTWDCIWDEMHKLVESGLRVREPA
ncbi:hypothetical protein PF008_g9182 [Phytophthora fragariae]|uniref:Uncharacterized protein n=1 Tax=Phytophthora fragariae TaxID=53985 RepID=A0A6G0RXD5_9STRA|nr:hypothetical protein PF008_g9182 [Phytophthora fragariae]